MIVEKVEISDIVTRWQGRERPLFKGCLIDDDGCKCAQGDVLSFAGYTDKELRKMAQHSADKITAKLLGISITHAVLLRRVNDSVGGAPQLVLTNPEEVIGNKAPMLLGFWHFLDNLTPAARGAAWGAARGAAWGAAWGAACVAAWEAACVAAWEAEWEAEWEAATNASSEIQGMDILEAQGRQPYFLAFFGLTTWETVRNLAK